MTQGGFMLIRNTGRYVAGAATILALLALGACSKTSDTAPVPTNAAPAAAAAAAAACNRQCLIDATDAYVAALVAHDVAKAPLSDEIAFVENAKKTRPGEGL